ncbi:hypothetical protein S40293_01611 [Stachybotrys chartarum IBT 40293]|nr:hypothetical protein S40293_01611 [Stachybotrys chartarum IBT 40293]
MQRLVSAQALPFRGALGRDLHGLALDADGIPNLEDTVSAQTSLLSGTSSPSTESHGDNDFLGNVFSKEASMHISKALMKFFTGGTSAKDPTADEGHGDEFEEGRAGLAIDASKASKRSRAVGHGENGAGDESDDDASRSKRVKIDGSENTKISCPFMKRNPLEFSTWRTCIAATTVKLTMTREHLKRRHLKQHTCQRCGQQFVTSQALQSHLRAPMPCKLAEINMNQGFMSQPQWDEISRKRGLGGQSVVQRWKEIYLVLFPEVDEASVPSPCKYHQCYVARG